MEVVKFTYYAFSGGYKVNIPEDQSGEYYRREDVESQLAKLKAERDALKDDQAQLLHFCFTCRQLVEAQREANEWPAVVECPRCGRSIKTRPEVA